MVTGTWLIVSLAVGYGLDQRYSNYQIAPVAVQKELAIQLADAAIQLPDQPLIWNVYVDEYTQIPTVETYFRTGRFLLPAGQPYFYADVSAWQADYPDLTPSQVAELVYQASGRWVDVAVVFADPDQGRLNGWMNNDYSRTVSDYMARTMATDAQWQLVGSIENLNYGKLLLYRNTMPEPNTYNTVLQEPLSIHPNPTNRL
jgi:hypothetical protein